MKICYFYSEFIAESIYTLPDEAMCYYTGGDDFQYYRELSGVWGQDDLITLEQGILFRDEILEEFENCPEQWCTIPYNGIMQSLGCTRFRKELQLAYPSKQIPLGLLSHDFEMYKKVAPCNPPDTCTTELTCWRHLDRRVAGTLLDEYVTHVHETEVRFVR